MRESCTCGSKRGALSNERSYRDLADFRYGPNRTFRDVRFLVANGGKAEVARKSPNRR